MHYLQRQSESADSYYKYSTIVAFEANYDGSKNTQAAQHCYTLSRRMIIRYSNPFSVVAFSQSRHLKDSPTGITVYNDCLVGFQAVRCIAPPRHGNRNRILAFSSASSSEANKAELRKLGSNNT